jgi:hypothetical protein
VIASGARPAAANGSRELFTEATSTVLISENGAVIRLSAAVVPGQLLFLIHQDSKREVVTQVLRKRYFRPTNCYVELQFTEPAPGFWSMEFSAAPEPSQAESQQSEVVARVQSAKPTSDSPRKPTPAPSVQEVNELKDEVEALRGQVKSLLHAAPGAVSSPTRAISAAAATAPGNTAGVASLESKGQESPIIPSKLSRLPMEPPDSFSSSGLLGADSKPYSAKRNVRSSRTRSSKLAARPGLAVFKRLIPLASGLVVFGTFAAWYTNRLPGLPPPAYFASAFSAPTNIPNSATPIRPAAQKTAGHADSTSATQTSKVSGGESGSASHETPIASPAAEAMSSTPPAYQPDKKADRGSIVTAAKRDSAVMKVVKRESLPSLDHSSGAPATAAGEGGVVPPKLLSSAQGIAPPEAVRGFVAGDVILDAVVGSDGRVVSLTVLSGRDSLRASAIERVKQYRYRPATQNGKPVPAHVTVTVQCWFEP